MTISDIAPGTPAAAPGQRRVRPFLWSVRREIFENRSIWVAPGLVTLLVLAVTALTTLVQAGRGTEPEKLLRTAVRTVHMLPAPIMLTTFLVAVFYCLDALYGERRDRSILFWKSLPVSDRLTVLSKAAIPLFVLPALALALSITAQLVLLPFSTALLAARGVSPALFLGEVRFVQGIVIMAYGLAVHVLWFAPLYGWMLMISAWARRAPFLWALVPPLTLGATEGAAFNTDKVCSLLQYRVLGAMRRGFVNPSGNYSRLSDLDPLGFVATPGLWVGLAAAGLFLFAAHRLRRQREPSV